MGKDKVPGLRGDVQLGEERRGSFCGWGDRNWGKHGHKGINRLGQLECSCKTLPCLCGSDAFMSKLHNPLGPQEPAWALEGACA